jgi:hypothetical protein
VPGPVDVSGQVRELRDLARRARRLALSVSNGDRRQLLAHAEELEQQALELEQRDSGGDSATPPPPVVQEQAQVQLQQQQGTGPPAEPDEPQDKG